MYPEGPLLDAFDRIKLRRSVKAMDLAEPGPSPQQLHELLTAGFRVPDHGKLGPWRIIQFADAARQAFGAILAERWQTLHFDANAAQIAFERNRLLRAPLVLAVISQRHPEHKIPEWEQILSAGAVCQNLLVSAELMGFAAQWLTEWYAYAASISKAMGLTEHESVAGFIYIGSAANRPAERQRPDADERISQWQPEQPTQVL